MGVPHSGGQVPQYPELVGEMAKRGVMCKQITALLGITFKTLNGRLYGSTSFTLAEAKKIHEAFFPDTDFMSLFSLK